jgi:hypothetical protein
MANAFSAGFQRIVYRALPAPVGSRDLVPRYKHFMAACSVGKWPRARTAGPRPQAQDVSSLHSLSVRFTVGTAGLTPGDRAAGRASAV